jgi:D-3-phosphoglycerate dehydrogenase
VRIGILEGDHFSVRAREMLASIGSVEVFDGRGLEAFLTDKEVLFVRLGHKVDCGFLGLAPRLKILCSPTTGHNHLDEAAMSSCGIELISLRGERRFLEHIRATPEHTLGLALALLRNYRVAFLDSNNRHWDRNRCRGDELFGMKVGLIGLGRVGGIVADYLRALGACVVYADIRSEASRDGCERCASLAELIEASELMMMCASYTDGQPPILDRHLVDLLHGKYFVNTARGELVDEAALLDLVRQDGMKGVATDVIANENGPNRLDEWLDAATGRNVIVTPHVAGATWSSMAATEEFIAQKLLRKLELA